MRRRRGFSLMEALMAATVLGVTVLAVISAVSAAQSVSWDGQKRILASIAADDLMIELITLPYEDVKSEDGRLEAVGEMESLDGAPYPDSFWAIGRSVTVEETVINEPGMDVAIKGLEVTITSFDEGADLATVEMFIPEPAE